MTYVIVNGVVHTIGKSKLAAVELYRAAGGGAANPKK
jgi:hypothetical protein